MSELISILIPILERDQDMFKALKSHLDKQIGSESVEIYPYLNNGQHSKGYYRNELLSWAKGKYLCFIDADDWVSDDYISLIVEGAKTGPTHLSLIGEYTSNGQNPELFEHSAKYQSWRTNPTGRIRYERTINHLNLIRADIAKQFKFPDISHGEDHIYSKLLQDSNLLKQEYNINNLMYFYRHNPDKYK